MKQKIRRLWQVGLFLIAAIGIFFLWLPKQTVTRAQVINDTSSLDFVVSWNVGNNPHELRKWTTRDLARYKMTESREIDPASGKSVKWKGVLVTKLIEEATAELSVES